MKKIEGVVQDKNMVYGYDIVYVIVWYMFSLNCEYRTKKESCQKLGLQQETFTM